MKGTVEAVKRDRKGFKLDDGSPEGTWYNNGHKELPGDVQRGVEVQVEVKDGKWWQKVEVTGGNPKPPQGQSRGNGASAPAQDLPKHYFVAKGYANLRKEFPLKHDHPDIAIIRQNALTNANALVASQGLQDMDPQQVIAIAREFEAYTTGQMDSQIISDAFNPEE